ncbi:MAG TPA: class I SAM-dependent methyltransferase [Jatrophihabitans sp.]
MAVNEQIYRDRDRAESFGSVAAAYDRFRPSYPDALISDLVELAPDRVLDIGCGTGKLAVPLVACGLAVLGIEVDPAMAQIARTHGLIVEQGAFETWDDDGRTFDLLTCGQAWHWIDPEKGSAKAGRLLNPGGTLALAWNHDKYDDDVVADLDAVYNKLAPEIANADRSHSDDPFVARLKESGAFSSVRQHTYRWSMETDTDEFIGRAGTYSDHIRLPDDRREALFVALRKVIDNHGGTVTSHYRTYTIFARTPER